MLSNDFERLGKILPSLFTSDHSFNQSKTLLLKGNGLGWNVIHSFDNAIPEGSIRVAINTLKADGSFKEILEETQD